MRLEGKKALITGAGRGIGRAVADVFLSEGAEVWGLGSREPDGLAEWQKTANGKLFWISQDLSKLDSIEGQIEAALKESGGFDILVNNAGVTKDTLSFRMSLEDWQKVIDINLTAAFVVARTVARDMIRRRAGSIINMASVIGVHGNAGQANYAASKAGLIALTKSLARETASRGVRANALAPGYITTDMTNVLSDSVKEAMLAIIPLKRMGDPADIAKAALFLASDDSAYITGQTLSVDGGMFI